MNNDCYIIAYQLSFTEKLEPIYLGTPQVHPG